MRTAPRVRSGGGTVVAVFGPTASGKSDVAAHVARALGTEVVSADAMQVYRGLPILTNRSRHAERLVGIIGLDEEMSVGRYAPLAQAAVDELVAANGSAVVVGGTGLYLRAALARLDPPPPAPEGVRARWEALYDGDPAAAYGELERLDPPAAAAVHRNDRRRVVRALELAETGATLAPEYSALWNGETRHPTLVVGLEVPPVELARRIDARTAEMFRRGVVAEVAAALERPLSGTARKVLGLDEIAASEPEGAQARIAQRTRRYAAYQRKWMRRIPGLVTVDATQAPEHVAAQIVSMVREPS
ncbi:MAG: tRNA (adenosine(37)-N6)-dimethylallyltransferase [Gaiella sp.]